ncbi:hypothetical protein KAI12_00725 [Candidatus Bathyarchaeota archaeon]|nr:hypothetical protein [Candidatus Bathyarchaeota archaeon]
MVTKQELWKGIGFGITSGVITTLGVIVGLHSGTQSRLAVLVAILVLAVADALSDAMGIHISEEAENQHSTRELWECALFTFLSKLCVALSFIIPVLLFELYIAILVSVIWGLVLITVFSYFMAKSQSQNPWKVVLEHVLITILVVLFAHYLGDFIHQLIVI